MNLSRTLRLVAAGLIAATLPIGAVLAQSPAPCGLSDRHAIDRPGAFRLACAGPFCLAGSGGEPGSGAFGKPDLIGEPLARPVGTPGRRPDAGHAAARGADRRPLRRGGDA